MRFQLQPTRWADLKDQMPLILRKCGARGGGRTHTALTGQGILSSMLPRALCGTIGCYQNKNNELTPKPRNHKHTCFPSPFDSSRKAHAKQGTRQACLAGSVLIVCCWIFRSYDWKENKQQQAPLTRQLACLARRMTCIKPFPVGIKRNRHTLDAAARTELLQDAIMRNRLAYHKWDPELMGLS